MWKWFSIVIKFYIEKSKFKNKYVKFIMDQHQFLVKKNVNDKVYERLCNERINDFSFLWLNNYIKKHSTSEVVLHLLMNQWQVMKKWENQYISTIISLVIDYQNKKNFSNLCEKKVITKRNFVWINNWDLYRMFECLSVMFKCLSVFFFFFLNLLL